MNKGTKEVLYRKQGSGQWPEWALVFIRTPQGALSLTPTRETALRSGRSKGDTNSPEGLWVGVPSPHLSRKFLSTFHKKSGFRIRKGVFSSSFRGEEGSVQEPTCLAPRSLWLLL